MSVLVVVDEFDVADLFRPQFRRELHSGRFAMAFAFSACMALKRIGVDHGSSLILVFSDSNMLGMTGLELLPHIRMARPNVPVIKITAYRDDDTHEKALEAGAASLLSKPIDFAHLREEINRRLATTGSVV